MTTEKSNIQFTNHSLFTVKESLAATDRENSKKFVKRKREKKGEEGK